MTKKDTQEEMQRVLINTYLSNLEIIKHKDLKLYNRLVLLSDLISNNDYTTRYELDFLEEDGEFDVFDKHNKSYIYNKTPQKIKNIAVSSVNFDKKGSFSCLESNLYENKKYKCNFDKYKLQENEDSNIMLLNNINEYVQVLKDNTKSNKKYKSINKFIFIGTLLGRHIPSIVNKVKAKSYFIHEPNLEIFRLCLFVFDLTILLSNGAKFFISIMEDSFIFEEKLYDFFNLDSWSNHTIKYHTTDLNVKASFDSIMNAMVSFKPTSFNYNMLLYNIFRNITERINKYKLLTLSLDKNISIFSDNPVLYICAGPSLLDSIEWIAENKNKFVIVSIGASYKKLLEHEIKPDIIITIDSKYNDLDTLQFDLESCRKIQDVIILASINTDQRLLDRFNQNKLYLFDVLTSLKKDSLPLTGYSVGEIGYRILLELGVENLYLLGADLAIHQELGFSHGTKFSNESKTYDISNLEDNVEKGTFDLRKDLVKVKGNLNDMVMTNRSFNSSISYYNKMSYLIAAKSIKVYNLSEHGAYFENTIPKRIEDLVIEKVIDIKNDTFVNKFNEITTIGITAEEKLIIIKQYELIKNLRLDILVIYNNNHKDYLSFKEELILLNNKLIKICQDNNVFLGEILSNYFSIVNSYIDYCFNDYKLKNEDKKISKVSKLLLNNCLKLLDDYLLFLKKVK
jgi:hypothetical protein